MESNMDIEGFLLSVFNRTRSEETRRAYRKDLRRYEVFLQQEGLQLKQVRSRHIDKFIAYLEEHKGRTVSDRLAPATIGRRLSAVSEYYAWEQRDSGDDLLVNPVERVKRPPVENIRARAVADSILERLIDGITDLRDRALVLFFLDSGLRLSELQGLNTNTIIILRKKLPDGTLEDFGVGEVIGKRKKRRSFIVGPNAVSALRAYISKSRARDSKKAGCYPIQADKKGIPLFLSSRKKRISCRAVQQIVEKWCKRLGLPHINIHSLRHSFATRNANAGMYLPVLQVLLGHEHLGTTQRYLGMKPETVAREFIAAMMQHKRSRSSKADR